MMPLISRMKISTRRPHLASVRAFLLMSALFSFLPQLGSVAQAAPRGFVTRSGTQFRVGKRPFFVGGTNIHYLGWGTRAEVDAVLQDAKSMNFNVVRTILHSVIASPELSKTDPKNSIWNFPSKNDSSNMGMHNTYILYWDSTKNDWAWNDSPINGLGRWDYVIAEAGKRGLKLNIALIDFWQWAGGTQQINAWWNLKERYQSFYTDPRTKSLYKAWVKHVLNRKNTLTGVRYKDDPTIFAWDLMNEPEIASVPLAQSWFAEMSAYVKSIDSNHLLCTGSEGFYGGQGGSDPEAELALPNIDFGVWHSYPVYHSIQPLQVLDRITQHGQTAARHNKPVIFQEFGYSRTNADQAGVYKKWTDAVYNDSNSAGWIVWRLEGRVVSPPTRDFPAVEKDPLGPFPADNGEGFGFYNDASPVSKTLSQAAATITARNRVVGANLKPKP
ncbi:mannan endo-1,4-beta-mannosidase [Abditibacterium utsteinense]|uniref:mannan endo-1,4-beta-mannosidase n=1 Tax=Abditibacterium utsteinense TaxID=1960156 RepID=A0A2S8SS21_9BACT|nr:cellulase family glycosylhydrolase [Abditibacterium utsteinense]PQV63587.1 mannan endo-1,4-beta-mannosidase [Abditibacterium utsteinense]